MNVKHDREKVKFPLEFQNSASIFKFVKHSFTPMVSREALFSGNPSCKLPSGSRWRDQTYAIRPPLQLKLCN